MDINTTKEPDYEGIENDKEQFYKFKADSLLVELKSIEYLKTNPNGELVIVVGKVKWKEESKSTIITTEKSEVEKSGWQVQILVKAKVPEVFYVRNFEGDTEESRYYAIFFTFKDILNNGIRLFHMLYEDQKAIMAEMIKKQGKIIA